MRQINGAQQEIPTVDWNQDQKRNRFRKENKDNF